MIKVSVIIPTYNRASTLKRALDSVISQSLKAYEVIVVDDGSTDQTASLLKAYTPQVKILSGRNRGVSHARNRGIQNSSGEWIAFLDSDDEWLSKKLEKQIALLKDRPDLKVIHSDEIWIRNGVRVNPMKKHQKFGGQIYTKCLALCLMSPSTILIHRSVFENVGVFREDFPVCEDYDLWLRICARYAVGFHPEALIRKYGGHEDQLSRRYKAMDYYRVKSLFSVLQVPYLSSEQKKETALYLIKKSNILLEGYQKHHNMQNYKEVETYYEAAWDFLHGDAEGKSVDGRNPNMIDGISIGEL